MRRTNSGALRRLPTGNPGGRDHHVQGIRKVEAASTPGRTLSRIAVAPVYLARRRLESSDVGRIVRDSAFLRAAPAIDARSIARRTLGGTAADVLLIDARNARASVVYRVIVRARQAGWERGIVLLLDPGDLGMVPVATAVGASDFVLGSATPEEVEARLRRASGVGETPESPVTAEKTGIELHWRTHQITFEGTSVLLTFREMQLLSVLIERANVLVTADDLSRAAWGKRGNPGSSLTAAYVCSLRKKLAWFGGRFGIQTVRAVGYRFVM